MAGRDWASLPADLLKEISGHLSSEADHLHIHQVCAHWRASTSLAGCRRPWIVGSRPSSWSEAYPAGFISMWLLDGVRRVPGFPNAPAGVPFCCGMPRGWLALSDHEKSPTRLVLWEPSSGAEVSLPAPPPRILQVFLAEDPLASPHWMAVVTTTTTQGLFFWRPGDESWSPMATMAGGNNNHHHPYRYPNHDNSGRVDSVAFHDGKMFVTEDWGRLDVYDLNLGTSSPPNFVARFPLYCCMAHVVACDGDLLLVLLDSSECPSSAGVYRPELDWAAGRLELGARVTDLGGYSLFVGRGDTLALPADDFLCIKRNHVYFLPRQQSRLHWVDKFDLECGTVKKYQCPQKHHKPGDELWPYSWFCLKRPFFKRGG